MHQSNIATMANSIDNQINLPPRGTQFNAIQLNCHRESIVSEELAIFMINEKVPIAILQEHHVQQVTGRVSGFPYGMRTFCFERGGKCNRAAIVINDSNMEAMPITHLTNERGICIWTKGDHGELYICSMYCKPNHTLEEYLTYLEEVVRCAGATPLLIGMDSNARSPMWHSKVNLDARGRPAYGTRGVDLEETIVTLNLSVLNEASSLYTFIGSRGSSDIDLTLGNQALADKFQTGWQIRPSLCTSDHNAIAISLSSDSVPEPRAISRTRWKTVGVSNLAPKNYL